MFENVNAPRYGGGADVWVVVLVVWSAVTRYEGGKVRR
jgi:hypothetical protein